MPLKSSFFINGMNRELATNDHWSLLGLKPGIFCFHGKRSDHRATVMTLDKPLGVVLMLCKLPHLSRWRLTSHTIAVQSDHLRQTGVFQVDVIPTYCTGVFKVDVIPTYCTDISRWMWYTLIVQVFQGGYDTHLLYSQTCSDRYKMKIDFQLKNTEHVL